MAWFLAEPVGSHSHPDLGSFGDGSGGLYGLIGREAFRIVKNRAVGPALCPPTPGWSCSEVYTNRYRAMVTELAYFVFCNGLAILVDVGMAADRVGDVSRQAPRRMAANSLELPCRRSALQRVRPFAVPTSTPESSPTPFDVRNLSKQIR